MPSEPLPELKERRFVEITPDNFDAVLESMKPRVAFSVGNRLSDDPNAGNLAVDLSFKSMEDFEPDKVASSRKNWPRSRNKGENVAKKQVEVQRDAAAAQPVTQSLLDRCGSPSASSRRFFRDPGRNTRPEA